MKNKMPIDVEIPMVEHVHTISKIMGQDNYCVVCHSYTDVPKTLKAGATTTNPVCSHQFFKIADEVKKEGEHVPTPVRWGVMIMCAICAERRMLWTDGEVEVL